MRILDFRLLCLALLPLLLTGTLRSEDAVTLHYKPTPNEPLIYKTVTTLKQKQTIGEMKIETGITRTMVSSWRLTETDDEGRFHWQAENRQLHVKAKGGPLGEYTFDSKSTERDSASVLGAALTPVFSSLNGAFLNVTLDSRGNVTEVKGYEDLLAGQIKNDPFSGQYTFGGTDRGAALDFQERFVIFCDRPVKKGDPWEADYTREVPGIGKLEGKKLFRHDGAGNVGDCETVKISFTYDASLETDYKFEGAEVSGTIFVNDSSGSAHFDPQSGQLVSLKSTVTFGGNVSLTAGGNSFDVPTEQVWQVEVQRLEKLPE